MRLPFPILLAVLLAVPLAAQIPDPIMSKDGKTATYQAPVDTVYRTAVRVAATRGAVLFTDKDAGVISVKVGPTLSIRVSKTEADATVVTIKRQGFNGLTNPDRPIRPFFVALTKALQTP